MNDYQEQHHPLDDQEMESDNEFQEGLSSKESRKKRILSAEEISENDATKRLAFSTAGSDGGGENSEIGGSNGNEGVVSAGTGGSAGGTGGTAAVHNGIVYHFKMLIPSVAAGAIIGKGGETIAAIQRDTGGRVKMSKSDDFYPGTSERVCLISGSYESIMAVINFIMDKVREKPDLSAGAGSAGAGDRQMKILVANTTAGMIIGKGGAFVKQMKIDTGCFVQVSQKAKDTMLPERCVTIAGEPNNIRAACEMVLEKIVEDPQSGVNLNISYSEMNGSVVANVNPTGSPYAQNGSTVSTHQPHHPHHHHSTSAVSKEYNLNVSGIDLSLNFSKPSSRHLSNSVTTQILDHIQSSMRNSYYSEPATNEVCQALGVLAKHGVLGLSEHRKNSLHASNEGSSSGRPSNKPSSSPTPVEPSYSRDRYFSPRL